MAGEEYRVCDAFVCGDYVLEAEKYRKVVEQASVRGESVTVFCRLLSDPVRIKILRALSVCELCVCVLLSLVECKPSALSYHLKLLKDAGFVDMRRDRNFLIYSLTERGARSVELMDRIAEAELIE